MIRGGNKCSVGETNVPWGKQIPGLNQNFFLQSFENIETGIRGEAAMSCFPLADEGVRFPFDGVNAFIKSSAGVRGKEGAVPDDLFFSAGNGYGRGDVHELFNPPGIFQSFGESGNGVFSTQTISHISSTFVRSPGCKIPAAELHPQSVKPEDNIVLCRGGVTGEETDISHSQ